MSLDTSLIQTQLRPHFEKKLLTTAQHTLVFDQFARDGDAFSGSAAAKPDDFDAIEEGGQAGDLL